MADVVASRSLSFRNGGPRNIVPMRRVVLFGLIGFLGVYLYDCRRLKTAPLALVQCPEFLFWTYNVHSHTLMSLPPPSTVWCFYGYLCIVTTHACCPLTSSDQELTNVDWNLGSVAYNCQECHWRSPCILEDRHHRLGGVHS
jgi:hypothetical protein